MKKLIIAAASTGIFLLAACSNDEKDFKESAEAFIESTEVESLMATTFSDTTCTEPASTDVGETFTCTTTAADGTTWDFQLLIDAEDHFSVEDGGPRP